jgi:Ca2+-binding RTX toxin-like protein
LVGSDADLLTGGAGADTFELQIYINGAPDLDRVQRDVITDFQPGTGDRIDLSDMDANWQRAGLQAFV